MRLFQERRKLKRIIFSKPALSVMLVLAILSAGAAVKAVFKAYGAYKTSEEIAARARNLEEEKIRLEERIERLGTPEGLEKEAKERFNVKKPGEEVLIIVNPVNAPTSSDIKASGGFWGFISNFLGR